MKTSTKLWIGLGILAVASPLGLYLPAKFKAGGAWGEWEGNELGHLVGFVPRGFRNLATLWHAPLPDYAFRGMQHADLAHLSFAYIVSALIGAAVCVGAGFAAGKLLSRKNRQLVKKK
jgi:hypothetical protein